MNSVSMPRLGVALWFASYAFWSIVSYLITLKGGERLPIFWTIVQATVMTAFLLVFIGMWIDTDKKPGS